MAGWTDSSASRGRGGAFTNRSGASTNTGASTRWRERRPQPQHQQHHRYHPSQHPRYSPLDDHQAHGGSSTSTRRPQPTPPPPTRPTFKSPTSANANANEPDDKARRNAANFECNVCFDMAADPVVTKCGHLYCWECLYQWLHVHSHHRECPVCKGQVADDAIIPIYGRGGSAASIHAAPPRPIGARVESSRQRQQQQAALDWHMDDDDDDDDNPFDLREIRLGFGVSSLRDAMMSFMPDDHEDMVQHYDDYTNPHDYDYDDFDEVHHYDLLGFPVFASAGAGSSQGHGRHSVVSDDTMDTFFDNGITTHQDPDFVYRGGRRQRGRATGGGAAAASADHSNIVGMVMGSSLVMGGSGASYSDSGAGHHITTGGSSRPNGGWTERRGRSNRNSNSGGGRGMQNSRRQGTNSN